LLCRLEIERYVPKLDELGLLADFTALAMPDWLAISPSSSGSLVPVDACPWSFRFLWEMSPYLTLEAAAVPQATPSTRQTVNAKVTWRANPGMSATSSRGRCGGIHPIG